MTSRKDFPEWIALERLRLNNYKPKTKERELRKVAQEWLSYSISGDYAKAPFGQYYWVFCVEMEQEKIWNFPEFQYGRIYGKTAKEPDRDANPYQETARARSWDCGYIWGLYEKRCTEEMKK